MPVNHKDLAVWQKSMLLACEVYKLFENMPELEKYALIDQMRRLSTSIPMNISEGHGRETAKEFVRFLYIARGSLSELQTQLDLCLMLGYFVKDDIEKIQDLTVEVSKMLNALIKSNILKKK